MKRICLRTLSAWAIFMVAMSCGCDNDDTQTPMTEEALKEAFSVQLDSMNNCGKAEDCVWVSLGCPLPCVVAVNSEYEQEAQEIAAELLEQYYAGGNNPCANDCGLPYRTLCETGKCALDFDWPLD